MEKLITQIRVQTAERTEETTGNQREEVGAYVQHTVAWTYAGRRRRCTAVWKRRWLQCGKL
jgi:hypothetical protein